MPKNKVRKETSHAANKASPEVCMSDPQLEQTEVEGKRRFKSGKT